MSQSFHAVPESAQSSGRRSAQQSQRESSRGVKSAGVRPLNGGQKRAGSPTFACDDHWVDLVRRIWSDYAFSTMYGVNVVDGNIVSYNNVQRNFTFGPGGDERADKPVFDDHWRALQSLCLQIGTGRLAEVKFIGGRPTAARTDEGGRRLKRFNYKSAASPQGGSFPTTPLK